MYVPSDPHEAYKMGVENAARTILEDMPLSGLTDPTDVINAIPSFLRKKLLIRKVTKWTGVILSSWSEKPTILELCDTKEEAEDFLTRNSKPLTKAIPIEIELPL